MDAYNCGTTILSQIDGIVIYTEGVCGSPKFQGISDVAGGGHGLKHLLRILAGSACGTRRPRCRTRGGACGISCSRCRFATLVDTHQVSRAFIRLRIDVYLKLILAGGGIHDEAVSCGRIIEGYEFHYILRDRISDAYVCGSICGHIKACAIIIYADDVCGGRKGISAVADLGHFLKHLLRILAESALICGCRNASGARASRGARRTSCRTRGGSRRTRGARARCCLPPCRIREYQEKGEGC